MTAWNLSEQEYVDACIKKEAYEAMLRYRRVGQSPAPPVTTTNRELTSGEAAEALGVSASYLRKLERKGWINRVPNAGRKVRYTHQEVERCRKRRQV